LAWVGEKGPELINAARGTQIIPNGRSMEIAKGSGSSNGTQMVTIPIYLDGKVIARVVAPLIDLIQGKGVSMAGRAVGVG